MIVPTTAQAVPGHAKQVHGALEVAGQKEHAQKVNIAASQAPDAILGAARMAGMVLDRHLGDAEALPMGQHGDVAVQFSVQLEVLQHFPAVDFEAAVHVVQLDAGQGRDGEIGELGWQPLGHGVLSLCPPGDNQIIAILELGQQLGQLGRVVLKVGIHGDDDISPCPGKAGRHGRHLAKIAPELDDRTCSRS